MHHEVGEDTFLATTVSEEGPYVAVFDLRDQIFDEDGEPLTSLDPIEYHRRGSLPVKLQYTVAQSRALAAALNKAADDVEVIRSLC